jgi:diacylglycerol O-acyltransferase
MPRRVARCLLSAQGMRTYQRLSAIDAAFLGIESPSTHMQVGAVAKFGPGPLVHDDGGVDIEDLRDAVAAAIEHQPRFRQKLTQVPLLGHWAWVDEPAFELSFHVRHARLPAPGDDRQLKRLAGRIFSHRLDREHPPWELWLVEGLADGGFAMIGRAHHCLLDGVAGAALAAAALSGHAPTIPAPVGQAAVGLAMTVAELRHRARALARSARALAAAARSPAAAMTRLGQRARGVVATLALAARPASPTALNPVRIGPHRRFDWLDIELERLRGIRRGLGGTINDVVLTVVTGALRRYLAQHGDQVDRLRDVRALVPVSLQHRSGPLGNAISTCVVPLPVSVASASERHRAIVTATDAVKRRSAQIESAAWLEDVADATSAGPLAASLRMAANRRAYNIVVTNVPGPPVPLDLFGSRLEAIYPMAPLFETQSLGVAALSYAGTLHLGISADWHRRPDLHAFVDAVAASLAELEAAAATCR